MVGLMQERYFRTSLLMNKRVSIGWDASAAMMLNKR
jgi:hypothetical protein